MLAKKERGTEWGARKSIDTDGNVAIVASFRSPGYRPPGTKRGLLDGMGLWDHRESDSFRGESLSCIRLSVMAEGEGLFAFRRLEACGVETARAFHTARRIPPSRLVSSDFADDDDVNYTGGLYTIYPPVDKELRILAPFLPRSSFLLPTFWLARRYSHPILVLVSPRARNGACHNLSRASRIFSRIENRN